MAYNSQRSIGHLDIGFGLIPLIYLARTGSRRNQAEEGAKSTTLNVRSERNNEICPMI